MKPGKESRRKKTVSSIAETISPEPEVANTERAEFPIVGIGASAGGLEAFELFFSHTQPDSGIAYVLIMHLDPNHVSMLTEILQRVTIMPMAEAQDNMRVAPNCVYVIPPNRDMILSNGTLKLSMPTMPHGYRMPIDFFLRSLAKEQGDKAIGIILSGTGSDGTLGLRDIHSFGGLSLVQDPQTAKFDGMPTSAIHAGYASYVLSPDKMAEVLTGTLKQLSNRLYMKEAEGDGAGLKQILDLILTRTGHDFSLYKKSTLTRRIARRMAQHNIDLIETYFRFVREFPEELKILDKELLINVTSFFRNPEAFSVLQAEVLPDLLADKPDGSTFRIWIPACSTGEEAYSIAIILDEFLEKTGRKLKVQIYATDLDDEAINQARTGQYLVNISQDLTPERLQRFFVKDKNDYRVKKGIRDMVVFAVHDITKDPPFTKLDLLSCRNLLIYLEPELQNRLMVVFNYSIRPGGVLFLSPSEGIGNSTDLFVPINRKSKIYRATHPFSPQGLTAATGFKWVPPSGEKPPEPAIKRVKETNFGELIRRVLLQSYSPASVVTNLKGDILFVHGEAGKYLELPSGQPTFNAIDMACEGLQAELGKAIENAAKQNVSTLNLELVAKKSGSIFPVSLSVRTLPDPDTDKILLLITFQESVPPASGKAG
ncbi:MAG: chemotaxis protein CheB [Leptospirales bacterium]